MARSGYYALPNWRVNFNFVHGFAVLVFFISHVRGILLLCSTNPKTRQGVVMVPDVSKGQLVSVS